MNPWNLTDDLVTRIRERVQQEYGTDTNDLGADPNQLQPQQPTQKLAQPEQQGGVMQRIQQAGRTNTMLYMRYHGTWRHVEPYEVKFDDGHQYFYGYCDIHKEIHSFRVDRIQDIRNTTRVFAPRWKVKIV